MGEKIETNISVIRVLPRLVIVLIIVTGLLILPSVVRAVDRLTDKEVQDLVANVEKGRSKNEPA
jgi:hypothetical protein